MTTETKPATDEEIEAMRSSHGIDLADFQQRIGPLIARIDAERERAEQAEEEAETIGTLSRIARETSAAHLSAAQQQIAALREALIFYRDGFAYHPKRSVTGVNLSTWEPSQALLDDCGERARAALAQTEGAEG